MPEQLLLMGLAARRDGPEPSWSRCAALLLALAHAGCLDWGPRRGAPDATLDGGADSGADAEADAAPDGDVDRDGPESCREIVVCLLLCQPDDVGCLGACVREACPASYMAASELHDCARDSCRFECGEPEEPACTACLADRCAEPWVTCLESTCEPG